MLKLVVPAVLSLMWLGYISTKSHATFDARNVELFDARNVESFGLLTG